MEINNLILDLSRRDADRSPWHKDDSEGIFHNHIHGDLCCFCGFPTNQNVHPRCIKLVRSQSAGSGGGSEIVQEKNNEKEC